LHVSGFLNEFKAMDYYRRETWRLWMANFIQHRTLDGENVESWDLGHNGVDIGYALDSVPYCTLPPEVDDLARREFWDLVRTNERNQLVHMSPNGKYWPRWFPDGGFRGGWCGVPDRTQSALTLKYLPLNERERSHLDLILDEPGALARVETILDGARRPDTFSDIVPYAAMYYLRDSWEAGAEYLLMQNFRYRSQDTAIRDVGAKNRFGGSARTQYSLSKGGRVLVAASPIVVDRKPDNRWHNAIPTGGKTNVCGQTGRHVVDTRFHTSARFDLAEAKQDAPYCRPEVSIRGDWYGHYTLIPGRENEPVTDVTAWRQVFRVRGAGLTIVSDRIESGGEHEYTQFFTLPVCIPEKEIVEQVAAGVRRILVEGDRLWTTNAGFENVTVRLFGPKLQFANRIDRRGEHQTLEKSQIQILQDAVARKQSPRNLIQRYCKRPVSARWTGKGNQVFVALLDTVGLKACTPSGAGFEAVTDGGARVAFQAGPDRRNRLAAGPVAAEAETLLAVEKDGDLRGIVLSCTAFAVGGKGHAVTAADFEYVLPKGGGLTVTPIHRPIDTVEIRPAANVFTDSVQVSFAIPTQDARDVEFRYTLDGAEPTLESARFTAPFTLRATAMVKVRPFRKRLKATPWHFTGTDCGKTITTIFRKERLRPRWLVGDSPGPRVEYMEGDWPTLFAYAGCDGVLDVTTRAPVKGLLVPAEVAALRKTDGPYALRYRALLNVPASGVYAFHAPEHLYSTTMDAGYDLRVWVDGEEWFPAPRLHSEHTWFIPLEKGLHGFKASFVDYRTKPFRNEYWMAWREEEMWRGIPVLEITTPDGVRQPLPAEWLW
ncbi:chitobiase/beta-hexosaminidase C-terminal domain-containing protein, partial [bacterium]|nr:chitobiase/beta-hexosaminidase C-terminal domain-containing protein [bacterium]